MGGARRGLEIDFLSSQSVSELWDFIGALDESGALKFPLDFLLVYSGLQYCANCLIFISFGVHCGGIIEHSTLLLSRIITQHTMTNHLLSAGYFDNPLLRLPRILRILGLMGMLIFVQENVLAQSLEKPRNFHFDGTITATNNGVSIIPSFTLGRPAAFFDLSIGGDRFSFDPMLRFGMDGKPWTFVLWGRYKVIKDKRFSLTIGGHPAFLFQEVDMTVNGKPEKMHVTNRYLAGEINSSYQVAKKVSTGIYYLTGAGIQVIGAKNSNFLAWNTVISDIELVNDYKLKINPQLFYLNVDGADGMYVNSGFTFSKDQLPIQFQAFFNQKIKSDVAGDDLVWNLSLLYNFSNTFVRK